MENVIVTIARQYGSGGKTIGEMYAKDQGINCYSREILRMASDDSGINEMLFNQADERLKGTTLFGWAKKVYKGDLIPPESDDFVSDKNLFNYQAKVIKQLAEQESCVLVGRCADFVLKDYPNVVSVFVHAPMDYCIARSLERSSITSEKEMEKFILNSVVIIIIITQEGPGMMQETMTSAWTAASWALKNVWRPSKIM